MMEKGKEIEISAYKSKKRVGDEVDVYGQAEQGVVNIGTVLKVITVGGVVVALLIKILV